ncbi:MAG: hypothetical protein R8G66_15300 [Cytophagales bacterium]|nr:hypothetical protein [Cytophagales bacterium]
MRKLLTLLCLFAFADLLGQAGEYRKILEAQRSQTKDEFFFALQDFQRLNPQFSNVYFQLAQANLDYFSSADPIISRAASVQYIYNAKINAGLAKSFYDEKEAIKNPEWYNLPKIRERDSLVIMINQKVDGLYDSVLVYTDRYEALISNYDKAVQKYLTSREGFVEINNSSNNLRELFLKADKSLEDAIDQVGQDFDSSMYYLSAYRDLYQQMPHPRKRQVLVKRQQIEHFRMNGITPSNFLADEIVVWDYGQWSKDFRQLLKEEVDGLKGEITEAYRFFQATNRRMLQGDECLQANLENLKLQRIINLVTKYDNQSILIDVFAYVGEKLEFGNKFVYEKNCNIIDNLPSDDIISRKARAFQNIYGSWFAADSSAQLIEQSPRNQTHFSWFYDSDMPEGAVGFSGQQRQENKEAFIEELDRLYELSAIQKMELSDSVRFARQDSLLLSDYAASDGDALMIYTSIETSDSTRLVYGKQGEELRMMSIQEDREDFKLLWEKPQAVPASYFKVLGDTSFVSVHQQNLVHFYSSGTEKVNLKLPAGKMKNLLYNYLRAQYSLLIQDAENDTTYQLVQMDYRGKTTAQGKFTTSGEVITHFTNGDLVWVFASISNPDNTTTLRAYTFDATFQPVGVFDYQLANELDDVRVVKNDDQTLTVAARSSATDEKYVYALLNYEGEVQHESVF